MNIKEFSKILGVSTATVSRAFRGSGRISSETRKRILEQAGILGYHPNIHARNMRGKSDESFGFFYPVLTHSTPDFFINEVLQSVVSNLVASDKFLQIYPVISEKGITEFNYERFFYDGTFAGALIVYGSKNCEKLAEICRSSGTPMVIIGDMPGFKQNRILFGIESGAEEVGGLFRKTGKKYPLYVRGVNDEAKISGFRAGLEKISENLITDKGGTSFQAGADAFKRVSKMKLDCVFCANDILAAGFIRQAVNSGIRVPEDIAVAGCDDNSFAEFFIPAITTVRFHMSEIGKKAAEMLLNFKSDKSVEYSEELSSSLIIRESTENNYKK